MNLGVPPQPTAPWRPLIFRVHCIVTQRWMKIRVPFAWYWYGDAEYGNPEVESGTIASPNPQPPANMGPRLPVGAPIPQHAGELQETELAPYVPPSRRQLPAPETRPPTHDELTQLQQKIDQLERDMRSRTDPRNFGSDAGRGGR